MSAYAAVLTHIPSTGETFYTPFEGADAAKRAKRFRESEEERGDFPGALWSIVYNAEADEQRVRGNIETMIGPDDGPGGMVDQIMRARP